MFVFPRPVVVRVVAVDDVLSAETTHGSSGHIADPSRTRGRFYDSILCADTDVAQLVV